MKTSSEFRAEARAALKGNWAVSALYFFVYTIVFTVVGLLLCLVPGRGVVAGFLLTPMTFGVYVGYLRQSRGKELQVGWLFGNFNGRIWLTLILKGIYIMLWSLLLFIPGVIKSYSYALTEYILEDNPEMEKNAAIEKSMAMMSGHKWDLFVLDLTFIGWYLLSLLTFGIAAFWIYPYQLSARAAFYEDLKLA